jgi:hypothetical protein
LRIIREEAHMLTHRDARLRGGRYVSGADV